MTTTDPTPAAEPALASGGDLSTLRPRRLKAGTVIKALVSVLLLAYVFRQVGWRSVIEELRGASPTYIAVYLGLGLVTVFVSALKWHVLCRPIGLRASISRLYLLYLVGQFFNHILPTSVGGDVVRAYELGRHDGRMAEAMASVFVERFTGLTTLIVFAVAGVCLDTRFLHDPRVVGLLGLVVGGYVVGTWMVFHPASLRTLIRINRIGVVNRALAKVATVQDAIWRYRHHRVELAVAMVLSMTFYALSVVTVYCGCLIFGAEVPISALCAAVPVMMVIFMMPVSLGGIGLQEWAYWSVLEMIGVPSAAGLSLGLIYRARAVTFGLVGGALYPVIHGKKD